MLVGMKLQWNDDLSLADASLDEQHQIFVQKINEFDAAVTDGFSPYAVTRAFGFLRDYAKYHFMAEEKEMVKANYPGLTAHVAMHDGFVSKIIEIKTKLDTVGASQELYMELSLFMSNWLDEHIRGADKAFVTYVNRLS